MQGSEQVRPGECSFKCGHRAQYPAQGQEAETAPELRTSYLPPLLLIDKHQGLPKGFSDSLILEYF